MIKRVEYKGKEYHIDTTPGGEFAKAEITQVEYADATGVFANIWEDATGNRLQDARHYEVNDSDLISLVLHLGHKFSSSKAWRRMYDWAYWEWRRNR